MQNVNEAPDLAQAENKPVIDLAVIQNAEAGIRALFAIMPQQNSEVPSGTLIVILQSAGDLTFKVDGSKWCKTLLETIQKVHDPETKRLEKIREVEAAEAHAAKLRAELEGGK